MFFKGAPAEYRYITRYEMFFDFKKTKLDRSILPEGFDWVPWNPKITDELGRVLYLGFRNDLDGKYFPTFRDFSACLRLVRQHASGSDFVPSATWFIRPKASPKIPYCAMIQCRRRPEFFEPTGRILNITVHPDFRHQGLGRAIVLKALEGFRQAGYQRVYLEVTADNYEAVNLYRQIGFNRHKIIHRERVQ